MKQNLWVSMPIIQNIVVGSGCNTKEIDAVCEAGQITPKDLEDPTFKVTLQQNCDIMEAVLHFKKDNFLGLHLGEKTSPMVLGLTGHLLQSSKDVFAALKNLQEYTSVFTRIYNFYVESDLEDVYYFCEPVEIWNDISPETARQSVDLAYSGALHIFNLLTGKKFFPKKVLYRYSKVTDLSEYLRIYKCEPQFNMSSNCIVFSKKNLQIPIIGFNSQIEDVFKVLLENEKLKQNEGEIFSKEVREKIIGHFNLTFPQLEEVAKIMHMTVRTLQRKLSEENTSFRALTDDLKFEISCALLVNKRFTISDIGYRLGYSEPSTFQRAFRQWAGMTPTEYRQRTASSNIS